MHMLTHQGVECPEYLIQKAKRELTVTPIDRSGLNRYPKRIPVWWTLRNTVHVPRFWAAQHRYTPQHTSPFPPQKIDVDFCGDLLPDLEQPEATGAVLHSLNTTGGALLSLGTGCGKTTCACYIISQIKLKTLVVVHKDVLRTQWAERIKQFLPKARVSFVQGQQVDTSGDVIIAMLQTLVSPGRQFDWSDCGLVIVDECHHIAAETFSTAMRSLACPYSLGLSATLERKDGLTKIIEWFLGKVAFQSRRTQMAHVKVEYVRYWCERYKQPPPLNRFGTIDFVQMINDLAEDEQRTHLIVEYVKRIRQDPTRIVLVLTLRREHCKRLASLIDDAVAFVGAKGKKMSNEHQTAPVVCATYSIASEGYDDPRLNTLVLATPVSDVTQAMGRITRGIGTTPPVIIDFMDDYGVFYAQAAKRKAEYKRAGFTVDTQYQKKDYGRCIIIDD